MWINPASGAAPFGALWRLDVGELHHVTEGDRPPLGDEGVAEVVFRSLNGHDGAGGADDDQPGIEDVDRGVVGEPNPERLERLIVKAVEQVLGRHNVSL